MVDVSHATPPTYFSQPFRHADNDLPAYTRRHNARRASAHPSISHVSAPRDLCQHTYELMNSKNRPWAKLTLDSSARSSQQIPTFFEDDPIAGTVALSLDKEDSITAISVSVSMSHITRSRLLITVLRLKEELLRVLVSEMPTSFWITPTNSGLRLWETHDLPRMSDIAAS
jgi:hypothetical protein